MMTENVYLDKYKDDEDLLKGYMAVQSCANGRNQEAFLGPLSMTKADGSFEGDMLPKDVRDRFLADGYIVEVPNSPGRYRRSF